MKNNRKQSTDNYRRFHSQKAVREIAPIPMAHWVTALVTTKEPEGNRDAHFSKVKFNLCKLLPVEETGFSLN